MSHHVSRCDNKQTNKQTNKHSKDAKDLTRQSQSFPSFIATEAPLLCFFARLKLSEKRAMKATGRESKRDFTSLLGLGPQHLELKICDKLLRKGAEFEKNLNFLHAICWPAKVLHSECHPRTSRLRALPNPLATSEEMNHIIISFLSRSEISSKLASRLWVVFASVPQLPP